MNSCAVIIPVFGRPAALSRTLTALWRQAVPPAWQVNIIISDDGSRDVSAITKFAASSPWPTALIYGPHAGSATARNRALARSQADIIFFLGADIILRPGALAAHLDFHTRNPAPGAAALGLVKWDPEIKPTPLMEWLVHGGNQNDFDSLLGQSSADPSHHFYGSHLSLKRSVLGHRQFSSEYFAYGWEDLDLGRSLVKDVKLYMLHSAIGLHHHAYRPSSVLKRQIEIGRGLNLYQRRYPNDPIIPRRNYYHRGKHLVLNLTGALWLIRLLASFFASRHSTPRLFSVASTGYMWRGFYARHNYPHKVNSYPQTFPH